MQAAVVIYYNSLQSSPSKLFQILNYIILALKAKEHMNSFVFQFMICEEIKTIRRTRKDSSVPLTLVRGTEEYHTVPQPE